MLAESVRFDDSSRTSTSEQPMPAGGALRALRDAAEMSGLDPAAELYNEALRHATDGHLRMARERLNVLLGINPDDGDARLLLAKVHVAGQRWQDALSALDEAQACGVAVPTELRGAVEQHLRADVAADREHGEALAAREQGEIKALRQEARRLRSENAQLLGRTHDLERETRKWAWTTTGVAVVGILFIAANLLFAGVNRTVDASTPPPVAEAAAAPVDGAPAAVAPVPAGQPPTVAAVAQDAKQVLSTAPGLDGAALAVTVKGTAAIVTGEVVSNKQKKAAESALKGVHGIQTVDTSGVTNLARTKGAEHTVGKGDSLSTIAKQYYGDGGLSKKILDANEASLHGKADLKIGQKLKIPAIK
jgi:nucleoid-associated protein YgaU